MSTDSGADITGYVNFRDLGGHTAAGGRVRSGRLFRSDSLAHVSDTDVDHLVGKLGIRTTIDLRHDIEVQDYPLDTLSAAGVHIHHIPLFDPSRPTMLPDDIASLTLAKIYRDLLENAGSRLIEALRVVNSELTEPLVFMCSAGKDRTGVLAALVLGLVGVSDDDIVADYAATGTAVELIVAHAGARGSAAAAVGLEHLLYAEAENMVGTLEWLHATHGGFVPWALANGYTEDEIASLRATLVESGEWRAMATAPLSTIDDLRLAVTSGEIDTVVLAIVDMHGRLQGKRFHAQHFVDEVASHRAEACNYLLAVDVDMNTAPGYSLASWEQGYGDFFLAPDPSTVRRLPWHDGTALVLADVEWEDGTPVAPSPRQVLLRQLARLGERGWQAMVGTELEFIVFSDTYEEAWNAGYHALTPSNQYNVDYSILGTSRIEHLLRRIRNDMAGAGLQVESAKGECNLGQHEIVFRYDDALVTCDNHTVYKTGAKEIAAQEGVSLTFMAKVNEREGNSCHVHLSLREAAGDGNSNGAPVLADGDGLSKAGEHFLAGQLTTLRELTLCFAPNINSYKRYQAGSFAPTAVAWGVDNRTCALRLVGHGPSLRIECRVPGGDANPYLAVAALVAGGLHGIEHELPLSPAFEGNAYEPDANEPGLPRVPSTLREAAALWSASDFTRSVFGDDVVDHYANMARVELAAFDAAVTNWELYRGFERL